MTKMFTIEFTDEEYSFIRWMAYKRKILVTDLLTMIFKEQFEKEKENLFSEFNDDKKFERETVGQKICRVRQQKGMTQAELAEKCGRNLQQISDWENGRRNPKTSSLVTIAKALGVSIEKLT